MISNGLAVRCPQAFKSAEISILSAVTQLLAEIIFCLSEVVPECAILCFMDVYRPKDIFRSWTLITKIDHLFHYKSTIMVITCPKLCCALRSSSMPLVCDIFQDFCSCRIICRRNFVSVPCPRTTSQNQNFGGAVRGHTPCRTDRNGTVGHGWYG